MVKKFVSVLCSLTVLIAMFSLPAFAEDILDVCPKCGKRTYETWTDFETSVPELNFPVAAKRRHCTSCDYTYYQWNCLGITGYKEFDNGTGKLFYDYLNDWINKTFGKNSTATKFKAGGGQPGTGGAGRYPSGYTSDGVPSVSTSGKPTLAIPHSEIKLSFYSGNVYPDSCCSHSGRALDGGIAKHVCVISGNKLVSTSYPKSTYNFSSGYARYSFKAPVDGYYRVVPFTFSLSTTLEDGTSSSTSFSSASNYSNYKYYAKGSSISYSFSGRKSSSNVIHASYIGPAYISVEWYPADGSSSPTISNTTNITINNNTWNGNIYQDTENNLTYIYPQYTTINENNQTVTNISNNPIIYNNTTNQYYTYDSTTNNYYYITYVTATPEPTASPEPTTTPDPGTTPTPTPGGDTSDTSSLLDLLRSIKDSIVQGFADLTANIKLAIENLNINIKNYFDTKLPDISTSETATPSPQPSSTPTAVPSATPEPSPNVTASPEPTVSPSPTPAITPAPTAAPTISPTVSPDNSSGSIGTSGNPLKWLTDLLKDIIESIVKGIWKLITSIFGFILWLLSLLFKLFPWMPNSAVLALCGGVVVVTVIRIIKFMLGR